MPITLNGDTGIQTPMYNGTITANAVTPSVNMKNRIINGAMTIDQRNAGASVTASAVGGTNYTLDRWYYSAAQASKFTVQQNAGSVTTPVGFTRYLGVTSSSAYSVTTNDYFRIGQIIEGFNIADLGFGTASAQSIVISFWVRSSLTGTFGGALTNGGEDRCYPFSYTISSANTWEQKSITVAGDTTGTWNSTTGSGMQLMFGLGAGTTYSGTAGAWTSSTKYTATGATSVVGTNGATFYLTGVQLEIGSTATSFDYRPYGTELLLCYRYFQKFLGTSSYEALPAYVISNSAGTSAEGFITHKTTMRAAPTLSTSTLCAIDPASTFAFTSSLMLNAGLDSSRIELTGASGMTGFRSYYVTANNSTSAFLTLSSEL